MRTCQPKRREEKREWERTSAYGGECGGRERERTRAGERTSPPGPLAPLFICFFFFLPIWRCIKTSSTGDLPNPETEPSLLHCRQILYQLSYKRNPRILEWVAYTFSRGSSWPRNQTKVFCIVDGFFTSWAYLYDLELINLSLTPSNHTRAVQHHTFCTESQNNAIVR